MTPVHSTKSRQRRYRYYTCSGAQRNGWHTCPRPSLPADDIERLVLAQVATAMQDQAILKQGLETLSLSDQFRVVDLLVDRADYDGAHDKLTVHLRDSGVQELRDHFATTSQEASL